MDIGRGQCFSASVAFIRAQRPVRLPQPFAAPPAARDSINTLLATEEGMETPRWARRSYQLNKLRAGRLQFQPRATRLQRLIDLTQPLVPECQPVVSFHVAFIQIGSLCRIGDGIMEAAELERTCRSIAHGFRGLIGMARNHVVKLALGFGVVASHEATTPCLRQYAAPYRVCLQPYVQRAPYPVRLSAQLEPWSFRL